MKKIITLLLILCMVFAMASCGKPSDTVDPEAEVEFLMVLITDKNGIEDNSLNESCWTGLQKAEIDFDVKVEYIEYDEAGYAKCFEEAVEMDPDLIICPNPDMAPVLTAVASQYMDDLFVIFDAEIPDAFNVTTVYFNPEQRAYLAGVAAALTSEENIVGFIGAESNELSDKYLY